MDRFQTLLVDQVEIKRQVGRLDLPGAAVGRTNQQPLTFTPPKKIYSGVVGSSGTLHTTQPARALAIHREALISYQPSPTDWKWRDGEGEGVGAGGAGFGSQGGGEEKSAVTGALAQVC